MKKQEIKCYVCNNIIEKGQKHFGIYCSSKCKELDQRFGTEKARELITPSMNFPHLCPNCMKKKRIGRMMPICSYESYKCDSCGFILERPRLIIKTEQKKDSRMDIIEEYTKFFQCEECGHIKADEIFTSNAHYLRCKNCGHQRTTNNKDG